MKTGILSIVLSLATTSFLVATQAQSQSIDLEHAPPSFKLQDDSLVVPIDMERTHVVFDMNPQTSQVTAVASVVFSTKETGFPMFDLVPRVTSIELNGESIDPTQLITSRDPDRATYLRILKTTVERDTSHILKLSYEIDDSEFTVNQGTIRMGFWMSDLETGGRHFWERYGPANFEFDHFAQRVELRVVNGLDRQVVFTNGAMNKIGPTHWQIDFPANYTSSSPYLHITDSSLFYIREKTHQGLEKAIPIVAYATNSDRAERALDIASSVIDENESTYGPIHHDRIVIYATREDGGMEYCGGTITHLNALAHEITHFWFARGVMPADGNAGWIDEAIASWRDWGYPRYYPYRRSSTMLSGFSPFRRHTTGLAYTRGATLIGELDYRFRRYDGGGGMRSILRSLYETHRMQSLTVSAFQAFLEETTGDDLEATFRRYVYGGRAVDAGRPTMPHDAGHGLTASFSSHPRPFTREQLVDLR